MVKPPRHSEQREESCIDYVTAPVFVAALRSFASLWMSGLLTFLQAPLAQATQDLACSTPEAHLDQAHEGLEQIERRLDASKQFKAQAESSVHLKSAEWLWNQAEQFYETRDRWTAIASYKNYLELVPALPNDRLQRSYERLSHLHFKVALYPQAYAFSKKYLATFVGSKSKNYDAIPPLLHEILKSLRFVAPPKTELRGFLSVLASIDFPPEYEDECAFLATQMALLTGQSAQAKVWFKRLAEHSDFTQMQAKALYHRGRLLLQEQKWPEAGLALESALAKLHSGDEHYDELYTETQLAYARLQFFLRKKSNALKHYEAIPEASPLYKDALYERSLLHASQAEWKKARFLSGKFLTSFPKDRLSYHLKSLLPYFDIQAQDLQAAQSSILREIQELDQLRAHIQKGDFTVMEGAHIAPPVRLSTLLNTESKLNHLGQSLDLQAALLQQSFISLSQTTSAQLQAPLYQRRGQLLALGQSLLTILQQINATESCMYKQKMQAHHWQSLKLLEEQRQALGRQKTQTFLDFSAWIERFPWNQKTQTLTKLWAQLQSLQAMNASQAYASASAFDPAQSQRTERQLDALAATLGSVLGDLNSLYLRSQGALLATEPNLIVFEKNKQIVQHEYEVLQAFRPQQASTVARLSARDANRAWSYGLALLAELEAELAANGVELSQNAASLAADLQTYEERLKKARSDHATLNAKFRQISEANLEGLQNSYLEKISQTSGRLQKWLGDINWQEYQSLLQHKSRDQAAFEMDKATLEGRLRQVDEGLLQAW